MTRFDAADPAERRKLFVDAITAHRERASPFLTIEVEEDALESESESEPADEDEPEPQPNDELGTPWLQFADGIVNLDCTDAELEALKGLLDSFPAFKIDELSRPDDTEGVNARVSAKADPNRIAQFFDATFQEVYGLPDSYRAWVVAV